MTNINYAPCNKGGIRTILRDMENQFVFILTLPTPKKNSLVRLHDASSNPARAKEFFVGVSTAEMKSNLFNKCDIDVIIHYICTYRNLVIYSIILSLLLGILQLRHKAIKPSSIMCANVPIHSIFVSEMNLSTLSYHMIHTNVTMICKHQSIGKQHLML